MFSYEIFKFFKNTYFEELLRTTASKGCGNSEAYSESFQQSEMKLSAKHFSDVNYFRKKIWYALLGSGYASGTK